MAGWHLDIHGRHTLVPAPAEDDIFQPEWDCGIEVELRYRSGSKWPYSKYEDLEEEICSGPQVERLVSPR